MADLIDAATHLKIRAAMQDVVDTFMNTEITYYLSGTVVDDFMEDLNDKSYTQHVLKGLVEYTDKDSSKTQTMNAGVVDKAHVKVTLGLDDLDALGLIYENRPIFNKEDDYMLINGEKFTVIFSDPEGAFEAKNVLVILYGERDEKQA